MEVEDVDKAMESDMEPTIMDCPERIFERDEVVSSCLVCDDP